MASNGRVNPNCANVSNPYHRCTEACLLRSKPNKPHTNKKKSGYGQSVTNGELGKKTNEVRLTHSGCRKASNPYHKCDENCHKRLSDSAGATLTKLDNKKKLGSKPEPLVVASTVPASKLVGAIDHTDASPPISHSCDNKKVESEIVEHVPSEEPISTEIHIPDGILLINQKEQQNQEEKISCHKVFPVTYVVDNTGEGLITIDSASGSEDFSFSGDKNEESDKAAAGEAEESVNNISESPLIPVGRYQVKESFGPILQSIFDKYGDIGVSCHLESIAMRSYYIECVCFVVQELQIQSSASTYYLTKSKVEELLAILKDVESAQLQVAWLRSILDDIAENIELINQHRDHVDVEKANNSDHEVQSLKEKLQSELQETLAIKEQEIADIQIRIAEIRDRLRELELKSSELDKSMLSIKSTVDTLHNI